jgi:hypothetical protein
MIECMIFSVTTLPIGKPIELFFVPNGILNKHSDSAMYQAAGVARLSGMGKALSDALGRRLISAS